VDPQAASELYLESPRRLREHITNTSFAERVDTLRHVQTFVKNARATRDTAIETAQLALSKARQAIAYARQALAQAQAGEAALLASIERAEQEFSATAGIIEILVIDHHTAAELAAAQATAADVAPPATATADA
jgi:hypothetical protein